MIFCDLLKQEIDFMIIKNVSNVKIYSYIPQLFSFPNELTK